MKMIKGPVHRAQRLFQGLNTTWNRRLFKVSRGTHWLTSDSQERQSYRNDPLSYFAYTIQGYRDILQTILEVNADDCIQKIPNYLPIYIAEGEYDPLARGVKQLVEKYKNKGIRYLTYHVFEKRRHALLFEQNKKEIYFDILDWLEERTYL